MFCPNCGTTLPDYAAFCRECGFAVASERWDQVFSNAGEAPIPPQPNGAGGGHVDPSDGGDARIVSNAPKQGAGAGRFKFILIAVLAVAVVVVVLALGLGSVGSSSVEDSSASSSTSASVSDSTSGTATADEGFAADGEPADDDKDKSGETSYKDDLDDDSMFSDVATGSL